MDFPKQRKRLENRFKYQLSKVRAGEEGALFGVFRSISIRLFYLCAFIGAAPIVFLIVLFVRLIRPWYRVRFGYFSADRIGHFAFDIEYYLKDISETKACRGLDLFAFRGELCNEQLGIMIRRKVVVHKVFLFFFQINKILPGSDDHSVLPARVVNGSRDVAGKFSRFSQSLSFTKEENLRGKRYLESLGMKTGDQFVCLMVRDSRYLEELYPGVPGRGWDYHSYRDSKLERYRESATFLANEGCWVLRMGKSVNESCEFNHEKIIDYANSECRNDFLDIWLMANCYFCISTSTGLDAVADVFRRPIVFVNFLPLSHFQTWCRTVLVPKTLRWSDGDRTKLTLREHLKHNYQRSQDYEKAGILVEDLTSKEIRDAVLEMHQRISGLWHETDSSKERQERFWQIFASWAGYSELHQWVHPGARFGDRYLEGSSEFLH